LKFCVYNLKIFERSLERFVVLATAQVCEAIIALVVRKIKLTMRLCFEQFRDVALLGETLAASAHSAEQYMTIFG
jgi:hypothetical protein